MRSYRLSATAYRDLRRIRSRLTREASERVADHVETELFRGFEDLARLLWTGHRHADISDETVLVYNVFEYAILFRRATEILIVRVVHGRRDLKNFP